MRQTYYTMKAFNNVMMEERKTPDVELKHSFLEIKHCEMGWHFQGLLCIVFTFRLIVNLCTGNKQALIT